MNSYLMESDAEAQRLEAKTVEAETVRQLTMVGLKPGMAALDAGAGTGAVARVMAEMVGPRGEVTALDSSEKRLAAGRELALARGVTNLRFHQADLFEPQLAEHSFDLVWCRFVLEYLTEPERVLGNLVRLAKRGGLVVVGDLDGNGIFHDPLPDRLKADLDRFFAILAPQFDPYAGRKLYSRFVRAGLEQIKVHCLPYHVYAGTIPQSHLENWREKVAILRPVVAEALGGEARYDEFSTAFLDFLKDPSTFTYSILLLVQGRKPL